jgi:hypothetical protein
LTQIIVRVALFTVGFLEHLACLSDFVQRWDHIEIKGLVCIKGLHILERFGKEVQGLSFKSDSLAHGQNLSA